MHGSVTLIGRYHSAVVLFHEGAGFFKIHIFSSGSPANGATLAVSLSDHRHQSD